LYKQNSRRREQIARHDDFARPSTIRAEKVIVLAILCPSKKNRGETFAEYTGNLLNG
jgi:hypothetical protein